MIEIDFTIGDFPDRKTFVVLSTRCWLAGLELAIDELLVLLDRTPWGTREELVGKVRLAVEGVRRELGEAKSDMEHALGFKRLYRPFMGALPEARPAGGTATAVLRAVRDRMAEVKVGLDLFLVLLIVYGRTGQSVEHRKLAQARGGVRRARARLLRVARQVERAFGSGPGDAVERRRVKS